MAPPHVGMTLHDADQKYDIARTHLTFRQGTVAFKFGPMYLTIPTVRVMFVFEREDDSQYQTLKAAAEKMHYECTLAPNTEEALSYYLMAHPHLVFVDARDGNSTEPATLCRMLRSFKGCEFSCLVAVVKKGLAEQEDAAIIPLLRSGYNRWFSESCSLGVCLNEMIQIEHNDLINLWKLMASETFFSALNFTRDSVIVTGPKHEIQYMNSAAEKLVGFSVEEMLGTDARDLHQIALLRPDVAGDIGTQLSKGKEWQGTLLQKRKGGECVPVLSKITPIDINIVGKSDYIVYTKENPFFMDKPFSADMVGISRRQSFAKLNAMVIEAPVTKVLNVLVKAKESTTAPAVVQQLDRVIDILCSSGLYNPQLGAIQTKTEEQAAPDLATAVTNVGSPQRPMGVRRFSYEVTQRRVSSASTTSSSTVPCLSSAPPKIAELLENDVKWEFDIIELETLTARRPLIWLGMSVFSKMNVHTSLETDDATIRNWLQLVESHYLDNPYHNSTHAGDVMQATAYFLLKLRKKASHLADIFDPLDEAICLISAVVHDIDHPGRSSQFLINSDNELAILYNDRSVLESHHAAIAFKLTLSDEKVNIFLKLDRDTYRTVRASVIDMVLATEMTKHFEHLSKFINVFQKPLQGESALDVQEEEEDNTLRSSENIILIKRMLIKCSDVSNPARPIHLCIQWAQRIAEEYCAQTDEEKRRGLPVVMPAFDRLTCKIASSQVGFVNYFVREMFRAWSDFGEIPELMDYIEKNYVYWSEKDK
ncbi:high affinity cAMP-specific and IBMX-insensitive 3',5'-cyclic phosphodiesterase 8B [Rhipicephalus sanguineus]|uniref:high affinity cAMP-specific and IBMX-insensitive 3',5'-cyclic phosphodiesterase 8B n=1 Tax=Rhipicephalus sanguineus TaxID=34632 RepID=UPI0020C30C67|nr:high affinity cAMP-specific and IBMX-insensitive 3',5'-cyclic phosphodiesterase 8B [Rhipicephalus sanguineus]